MKLGLNQIIISLNLLCLIWISIIFIISPGSAKPIEALVITENYNDIVEVSIRMFRQQACNFYFPSILTICINLVALKQIFKTKKMYNQSVERDG